MERSSAHTHLKWQRLVTLVTPLWHCHRVPRGEQVQRAASLLRPGLAVLAAVPQPGEVPLSYQEGAGRAGPGPRRPSPEWIPEQVTPSDSQPRAGGAHQYAGVFRERRACRNRTPRLSAESPQPPLPFPASTPDRTMPIAGKALAMVCPDPQMS